MFRSSILSVLLLTRVVSAQEPSSSTAPGVNQLFSQIWRVTSPTRYPNSSSIYVFLSNGTLLETSCVETYRVATWKAVPNKTNTMEVTEDGRVAFTATILAVDKAKLRLQQTMALGNHETQEVDFTAINKEFVCPDMPK
jgi:hypothetical protein